MQKLLTVWWKSTLYHFLMYIQRKVTSERLIPKSEFHFLKHSAFKVSFFEYSGWKVNLKRYQMRGASAAGPLPLPRFHHRETACWTWWVHSVRCHCTDPGSRGHTCKGWTPVTPSLLSRRPVTPTAAYSWKFNCHMKKPIAFLSTVNSVPVRSWIPWDYYYIISNQVRESQTPFPMGRIHQDYPKASMTLSSSRCGLKCFIDISIQYFFFLNFHPWWMLEVICK